MKTQKKPMTTIMIAAVVMIVFSVAFTTFLAPGDGGETNRFFGTIWSLLPPMISIILALITKEVYSSLFIGILVGALMYSDFSFIGMLEHTTLLIGEELGGNGGILIFLIALGIIVVMMEVSGCTLAFGKWASKRISTKRSALITTTLLGMLFVIDDYFNSLTTGNVMRPVTDEHRVSRARLAYNVDCTSAPICIIAPISSWAAAVTSYVPDAVDIDGFTLFVQAIPFNYYAILTLLMLFTLAILNFDFGPMRTYEYLAEEKGDIYGGTGNLYEHMAPAEINPNGKVIDMILPVLVLMGASVMGLLYTGGFFSGEGVSIITAFSNCDAFIGLPIGGLIALFFTIIYYFVRRIINMEQFTEAIPDGAVAMMPAILILTLSWGISTVCRVSLGATDFVAASFANSTFPMEFLPPIVYLISTFISFATGTSWGTFGIMIPITIAMFNNDITPLCLVTISATLAGAVSGDHCSPISETAIMSSTAAQVDFMTHVMTQLPYAIFVMGFSLVGFLIAGFVQKWFVVLPIMIVLMVGTLMVIKKAVKDKPIKMKLVSGKAITE